MVVSVAAHRLERLRVNGRYMRVQIRKSDLTRVRRSILHALGMETWHEVESLPDKVSTANPSKNDQIELMLDTAPAKP